MSKDLVPANGTTILSTYDLPGIDLLLTGQIGASSIAMYRRDVAAYQLYCSNNNLNSLDADNLVKWRDHLAIETTKSPNTINRMLSAVKRVIREASSKKILSESVFLQFDQVKGVKVKALKKRLKQYSRTRITAHDMRRLCEMPNQNTLKGKRDRALLAALASSGGRVSEVATLTREQIVRQGVGYVIKVMGKTDIEYRDAHLSIEAYNLIQEWIAVRSVTSEYIFTGFAGRGNRTLSTAITEGGVWKVVQQYAGQCGLEHIKPHDFRRFVGTELAKKDIRKAQKALGHKSIEVTARNYVLDQLEAGETDNLY